MTAARILVVEDQRVVARHIEEHLTGLGYSVVGITASGAEAVRLAEERRPDLVLMDIRLEGPMDGVEAADQIRQRSQLPVVFLTAYADEETLRRAKVTEPFGYILKPFEERELRTVIEMALYKHEAERKLRESERRYAVTLSSIGDAVIATDNEARVAFMNPVADVLTGWRRSEASGRPVGEVFRIINQHSRQPVEDPVAKVLRQGTVVGLANHTLLLTRDGRELPVEDCGAPIIDDRGNITGAVLVFHDATERRRSEESLILFRALIDKTNDVIEVVDPETGRFLDVNETAVLAHGYTREEYLSLRVHDLDPTLADPAAWSQEVDALRKFGSGIHEGWHRRKDGTLFPVEVNVTYIRLNRDYILAVVRDVSERKRAEEELQRTAGLLRAVADGTTDAVFVKDREGKYLLFNEAASRFVGKPVADVLGNDDTSLFDPESARWVMGRDRHVMESGETETVEEKLTAAGVTRTYLATKAPYRNERGEIVGLIGISRDISDRTRAEEAVRRSEAAFRRAQAIAHVGNWAFDVDRGTFTGSEEGYRMCGWAPGPHREEELLALVHPEDLPRMRAAWQATLRGVPFELEHRLVVGGQVKWVDVRAEPEIDPEGRVVRITGVTQETTERRHLEEQLLQSQKMEAVGRLAAGVAHDFNNLLTVILGYCDVLLAKLEQNNPMRDQIGQILNAGMRAASLTRQLLAFSRKQILAPEVIDLNDVVVNIEPILARLIGEDIHVATNLNPALSWVEVDPGQIEQVIVNLAVNSRDAMPQGGQLTIETRNVEWSEDLAREFPDSRPNRYVMLSMTDTGCGMTPDVKARIFDPFFTTKAPDKGTGLGLATVYGIVTQSGGQICVDSQVGEGTTFRVLLPASRKSAVADEAEDAQIPRGGHETVLLVEDEDGVRGLARDILNSYGYTVLEAANGREAVAVVNRQTTPIHILVTDVVMPEMSGPQLAEILAMRHPGMSVLYMSGYTDDAVVRLGMTETHQAFLSKPFTPLSLAHKVRESLEGRT